MKPTSKTVIFFGTDEFSAASLRRLIADGPTRGFEVGAVITKPDSPSGRGRKLTSPVVKEIAEAHGIPVYQPAKTSEIAGCIEAYLSLSTEMSKPIGVLVSYGKIVPQVVIDMFKPGIINLHPSLLPKYRGPSPIETAILNGDTETGLSIMKLTEKMDAGPIYKRIKVPLSGSETAPELRDSLAELGAKELCNSLESIIGGVLSPENQDESQTTYCHLLSKNDSRFDPASISAVEAERRIRAYLTFPKSKIVVGGHEIIVTKAHVGGEGSPLEIKCRDGQFLIIDELIGPNGRKMGAKDFLNGYA